MTVFYDTGYLSEVVLIEVASKMRQRTGSVQQDKTKDAIKLIDRLSYSIDA